MTIAPRLSKQKIFSNFSKKEARIDEARKGHAARERQRGVCGAFCLKQRSI